MLARLAAASLALVLTAPASAQTQFSSERGSYVSLQSVEFGSLGLEQIGVSAGYRIGNGIDLGVQSAYGQFARGGSFSVGPVAGISRQVGAGFIGRAEATAVVGQTRVTRTGDVQRLATTTSDAVVTLARSFPVVGSLRVQPGVGMYVAAQRVLAGEVFQEDPFQPETEFIQTGLHIDLPLTFRVFGADAAYVGYARFAARRPFAVETGRYGSYVGGGLRVNV